MSAPSEPSRPLRITGPSAATPVTARALAADPKHPSRLHRCRSCDKPRVYPEWIEPLSDQHHRAQLRCPDCGERTLDVYSQEQVDTLDEMYEEGCVWLVRALRALQHARMSDWAESFAAALHDGHIVADDF